MRFNVVEPNNVTPNSAAALAARLNDALEPEPPSGLVVSLFDGRPFDPGAEFLQPAPEPEPEPEPDVPFYLLDRGP